MISLGSLIFGAGLSLLSAQDIPAAEDAVVEPEKFEARDFLGDTATFISERKSKLLMRTQENDIFGRPQDLNKPAPVTTKRQLAKAAPKKPRVPLGPLLERIPITLLDTASKRVLLNGGATLKVGEIVEVAFRGDTVRLRLDAVRRQGAYFRNMENGDLGLATMSSLANGISRDGGSQPAEGIQRITRDTPRTLNLDGSGSGPPDSGLSRR